MGDNYHKLQLQCDMYRIDINRKLRLIQMLDQRLELILEP